MPPSIDYMQFRPHNLSTDQSVGNINVINGAKIPNAQIRTLLSSVIQLFDKS